MRFSYQDGFDLELPSGQWIHLLVRWHVEVDDRSDPGDGYETPACHSVEFVTKSCEVLVVERYDSVGWVIDRRQFEGVADASQFQQQVADWCPHSVAELAVMLQQSIDLQRVHLEYAQSHL